MNGFKFNHVPFSDYSNSSSSDSESIPSRPLNLPTNLLHDRESTSTSTSTSSTTSSSSISEGDSVDMGDSSNSVLKFISEMLMEEEEMEGKPCMLEDSLALQAAEKSFYDVLGQKYPPSPIQSPFSASYQNVDNLVDRIPQRFGIGKDYYQSGYSSKGTVAANYQDGYESSEVQTSLFEPQVCTRSVPYSFSDLQSFGNFRGGTGDASSVIIPSTKFGITDMERNPISMTAGHGGIVKNVVDVPEKEGNNLPIGSRAKRNHQLEHGGDNLEGRDNKHSAVYADDYSDLQEMFDKILLNHGDDDESNALRGFSHVEGQWKLQQIEQEKGSGKKTRSKKLQNKKKEEEMVDLWTLLTHCAQAAASYDQKTATNLLKQIREHSSVEGDATQRVAHYFANGLEARLEGIRTPSYTPHVNSNVSAVEILKAYHIFVTACPFKRMSNFFANRTILKLAQKATRIHIIDFGILFGFQWPCLIRHLSARPGGPPKLRITAIELPQPGFRPSATVEGAVRRLENYCKRFNVPAEFKVIAQKWETIRVEDLNIDRDEFTAVNCLSRLKHMPDETVMPNNPRDTVLKLIRSMNPDVFITGVVNGTFNSPFFITRFKEALFHYFTLFDMLDASVPRENKPRMNFEKAIYGKEIMNVIGCEGAERIVRPDTYKQWQARITNAGFKQKTLNQDIVEKIKSMVKLGYHKNFVVGEQGQWLLQGWKGRIAIALTSWKPA